MNDVWKIGAIVIAIVLITCGAIGWAAYNDAFKGEKGDKGDTGVSGTTIVGPRGPWGRNGTDGKDAIPNIKPSIDLETLGGNYAAYIPTIFNSCKYTYDISVDILDIDDTDLRITFYTRASTDSPWIVNGIYFGGNGSYSATQVYPFDSIFRKPKTNYWMVEVWDGSDISLSEYLYTLTP